MDADAVVHVRPVQFEVVVVVAELGLVAELGRVIYEEERKAASMNEPAFCLLFRLSRIVM